MARARQGKSRSRGGDAGAAARRELTVGRPLQARLIALEMQIGVFSAEPGFGAGSRFNHPVILAEGAPVPKPMAEYFTRELAELKRLGKAVDACHAVQVGPYRVCCRSYFHYDGFKALLYVEHEGTLVAAWKEEEVLQPHSPRTLTVGGEDAQLEQFLAHVPAA